MVRNCSIPCYLPSVWLGYVLVLALSLLCGQKLLSYLFLLYGQVLFNSMLFTLSQVVNCFILNAFPSLYGLNCFIPNFLPSLWLRVVLFYSILELVYSKLVSLSMVRKCFISNSVLFFIQELFYSQFYPFSMVRNCFIPNSLPSRHGYYNCSIHNSFPSLWFGTVIFLNIYLLYSQELFYSKLFIFLQLGAILFPILSLLYGQKLIYSKRFTFSTWLLTVLFLTLSPLYCLEPFIPEYLPSLWQGTDLFPSLPSLQLGTAVFLFYGQERLFSFSMFRNCSFPVLYLFFGQEMLLYIACSLLY